LHDRGSRGVAIAQVARSILVINGPNLNLLGTREPAVYGRSTLADVERELAQRAAQLGLTVQAFQSNHEGALIDRVHAARTDGTDFIIINAGAFTHTSVALRDALAAVAIAFVEVHISNVYRRERFRHRSLLSDLAVGAIAGLGTTGYRLALEFAATYSAPPAGAGA
jgi:3-dehydroquinate dehydratase-2